LSFGVAGGDLWGFHASKQFPIDEPWLTCFALLPPFAAALIFLWGRSVAMVAWLVGPWLLHDAAYLAALAGGQYSWMDAQTYRATHGMLLVFMCAPTLALQVWLLAHRVGSK
jgi:hypothetical protein